MKWLLRIGFQIPSFFSLWKSSTVSGTCLAFGVHP